jgi:hypothetical protein
VTMRFSINIPNFGDAALATSRIKLRLRSLG